MIAASAARVPRAASVAQLVCALPESRGRDRLLGSRGAPLLVFEANAAYLAALGAGYTEMRVGFARAGLAVASPAWARGASATGTR